MKYEKLSDLGFDLAEASADGNLAEVKRLIEKGADVRYYDDWPLARAIMFRHLEVATYLLSLGADINADNCYAFRNCLNRDISVNEIFFFLNNGGKWPNSDFSFRGVKNLKQLLLLIELERI